MRSIKIIFALSLVSLLYIACEKEKTPPVYTDNFIIGDWTVSSFLKNNNEIASQFAGYTFYCTENGGMSIKGNGKNYNCNWNNMNNNDSLFNFQIMGCGQNSPLYECIDDWNLVSADSLHCCFTSHNPDHHRYMVWERKP